MVEVVTYADGDWLYAASDGTVALMNERKTPEKYYDLVGMVGGSVSKRAFCVNSIKATAIITGA